MAKSESALNFSLECVTKYCKIINFGGCHSRSKCSLKHLILRQQVDAAPMDDAGWIFDLRYSTLA